MAMAGLPRHQVLKYMKSLVAPLALVVAVDVCLQLEYGLVMLSAYHSIPVARADPDQHFRRGGAICPIWIMRERGARIKGPLKGPGKLCIVDALAAILGQLEAQLVQFF